MIHLLSVCNESEEESEMLTVSSAKATELSKSDNNKSDML